MGLTLFRFDRTQRDQPQEQGWQRGLDGAALRAARSDRVAIVVLVSAARADRVAIVVLVVGSSGCDQPGTTYSNTLVST